MDSWSRLHEKTADSEAMAELIDEHPQASILWFMMIAKAGVWGRFPGRIRAFRHRVCGLCESFPSAVVEQCLTVLEERGMIARYDADDQPVIYIVKHFDYNPSHGWHRVGSPEFPHPPGFTPPPHLVKYLQKVRAGKFEAKSYLDECAKFGVIPESAPSDVPEQVPGVVQGVVLGVEPQTESEAEAEPPLPPHGGGDGASAAPENGNGQSDLRAHRSDPTLNRLLPIWKDWSTAKRDEWRDRIVDTANDETSQEMIGAPDGYHALDMIVDHLLLYKPHVNLAITLALSRAVEQMEKARLEQQEREAREAARASPPASPGRARRLGGDN